MLGVWLPASKSGLQFNFRANDSVFRVGLDPGFQSDTKKLQTSQGKTQRRPTYDLQFSEGHVKSRGDSSRDICNHPLMAVCPHSVHTSCLSSSQKGNLVFWPTWCSAIFNKHLFPLLHPPSRTVFHNEERGGSGVRR